MAKYRIYEIAKELNTDSKKVMNFLSEHKITVKSQLSSVEEDVHSLIINNLKDHAAKTAAPKPAEKSAAPVKPAAVRPAQNPRPAAPAAEVKRDASTVDRGNRQDHHNNNRPAGSQNRSDGNRGGFRNNDRNNDRSHSDRTGAPRQHTAGGNRDNRPGQNNGSRPSNGSRFNDRQGSNGHTGGNNRGFQKNDREGGYNKNGNNQHRKPGNGPKDHAAKPAAPVGMNSAHAGKEMGKRNSNFHQHEKKDKIKGSYATRENRPTRSADHMMHNHKHKNNNNNNAPKKAAEVVRPTSIEVGESISVKEFAAQLGREASEIIKKLFMLGKMVTINQEIDHETAELVALDYNCEVKEPPPEADPTEVPEVEDDPALRVPRPPVVTVMGHVDHGKTSLLDAIRHTNVIDREAGGITQHIGAYVVEVNGEKITFLDTPGHEAFTAMRMRGASSTDIAILVVAADDGVMPQTVEAINHAKAAGVEIVVAVNKIDKPSANIDRVKQELTEYELIPEDWGGSTIFVPVSAKTGEGLEDLMEMIVLTAEVMELKANPNRRARGLVLEAELDKGRGSVATVLVQKGTLRVGDSIAAGSAHGKVRAMMDDKGRRVKEAGPSMPVEILGLNDVPNAGEVFVGCANDKEARSFAETFISQSKVRLLEDTKSKLSLDDLFTQIQEGNLKELGIVVKADVQGSVEAIKQSLLKLSNDEVVVKIIHGGVGAINESDVSLASASNAIIIGFNVRPDATAKETADREGVDLRLYRVIYNAIEDVEAAMKGMLDPVFEEKVLGHAEVRQIFKASGVGTIAGSYVLDGTFERDCSVRITRDGIVIFEGPLASLKRFKDDVKEVRAGYECGFVFANFNDVKEGDIVEAFKMVEIPR